MYAFARRMFVLLVTLHASALGTWGFSKDPSTSETSNKKAPALLPPHEGTILEITYLYDKGSRKKRAVSRIRIRNSKNK